MNTTARCANCSCACNGLPYWRDGSHLRSIERRGLGIISVHNTHTRLDRTLAICSILCPHVARKGTRRRTHESHRLHPPGIANRVVEVGGRTAFSSMACEECIFEKQIYFLLSVSRSRLCLRHTKRLEDVTACRVGASAERQLEVLVGNLLASKVLHGTPPELVVRATEVHVLQGLQQAMREHAPPSSWTTLPLQGQLCQPLPTTA
mmetsp:Transcript_58227/g.101961  ORF Transcript_58227/g.101961 Transcript_58227/m.101961 type:complete len:206 (-) Transcript_58227:1341-1958(-)